MMISQALIQDRALWAGLPILYFSLLPGQVKVNVEVLDKS